MCQPVSSSANMATWIRLDWSLQKIRPKPPRHLPVHRGHLASIAVGRAAGLCFKGGKGDHVLVWIRFEQATGHQITLYNSKRRFHQLQIRKPRAMDQNSLHRAFTAGLIHCQMCSEVYIGFRCFLWFHENISPSFYMRPISACSPSPHDTQGPYGATGFVTSPRRRIPNPGHLEGSLAKAWNARRSKAASSADGPCGPCATDDHHPSISRKSVRLKKGWPLENIGNTKPKLLNMRKMVINRRWYMLHTAWVGPWQQVCPIRDQTMKINDISV